ncbi:MAG: hypothetical protein R3E96_06255 [Planctomycetota bacterium]
MAGPQLRNQGTLGGNVLLDDTAAGGTAKHFGARRWATA